MYGYGNSMFLATHGILAKANAGTAPVNTIAPVISGSTSVGSTLTTTTGTWTGTPVISYTYQWYRGASQIVGATNSTYVLVSADVSNSIKCRVTATNAFGSANADSNSITATWESDAQAFITAASITNPTQQSAINQLVVDLKGYNIWTKMKALYPFVGGTAAQHKWNLKDPRDLDAAFRIFWNGGVTHSSNGVQFGGVNGWAETYLNANTAFTTNDSFHGSIYSRTNSNIDAADYGGVNASARTELWIRGADGNLYTSAHLNRIITPNSNSTGYYISTRTNSTTFKVFKNNSQLGSTYTGANGARLDVTMPIGAYKIGAITSYFSNRQYAFASIGDGLTDTEAANFYTAVQAFQTTLGRQV